MADLAGSYFSFLREGCDSSRDEDKILICRKDANLVVVSRRPRPAPRSVAFTPLGVYPCRTIYQQSFSWAAPMAAIRKIQILNFRSIRQLTWDPSPGINCLIGPGDSGKSTVLDAIDLCLCARRSAPITDADFHTLDVANPISITLTLGGLDEAMKSVEAYGDYLRGYRIDTGALDDEPGNGAETVLCLNLTVGSDLEPVWTLYSERAAQHGNMRGLAWSDRQLLSPTRIGATSDSHLSWRRGSVLNRISEERADASTALVAAARDARTTFGEQAQQQLAGALDIVGQTARELGVDIGDHARALLDIHGVTFSGGSIALHNESGVPLHGLGTGSTRLLIAGLERRAAGSGHIVLADEVEYGLEPHRLIRFLGSLGAKDALPPLQAFLTTHSPVALQELRGNQLFVVREIGGQHDVRAVGTANDIQGTIRCFPEAFLARSVIACEGASEIGFIRGIDQFRTEFGQPSLSALGVATFDCGGRTADTPYERASVLQRLGYRAMVFRDNDKPPTPAIEDVFLRNGGSVLTWPEGRALEDELFSSLPVSACVALITYAVELHGEKVEEQVRTISRNDLNLAAVWAEAQAGNLSPLTRSLLGRAARTRKNGWFKSISWMEHVSRHIVCPVWEQCAPDFQARISNVFAWAAHG